MSYKDGGGKSLKGGIGAAAGGTIDMRSILAALTSTNLSLSNVSITNATIYSAQVEDMLIGSVQPASATFTKVTVGLEGIGGNFKVYGKTPSVIDDSTGEITSPADNMTWNPDTGSLSIIGGLSVTRPVRFGNIQIWDNTIGAVNTDGDIYLSPNSTFASIYIGGNLRQNLSGIVELNKASSFSVESVGDATILTHTGTNSMKSIGGDISLETDIYKISSVINNIEHSSTVSLDTNGDSVTLHFATITTNTNHSLQANDILDIVGSNTIPNLDGRYTVVVVPTSKTLTVVTLNQFISGSTGKISTPKTGSIGIYAGKNVNFSTQVPLTFGSSTTRPYIITTDEDLLISATNIVSNDPIVTLKTYNNMFSDSGICVQYIDNNQSKTGFFGFVGSTQHFTWIPSATVTQPVYGKKIVTGTKGIMDLEGVLINRIIGNPNLILDASNGSIIFQSQDAIKFPDAALQFGEIGSIIPNSSTNTLTIASTGDIQFLPTGNLRIPSDVSLYFGDDHSITKDSEKGLVLASGVPSEPVYFNGNAFMPSPYSFSFGKIGNAIAGDASNINIGGSQNINLSPLQKVTLPDDILFQIGNTANSGVVGHSGDVTLKTVRDAIISSSRNVSITGLGGQITLSAVQVKLQSECEVTFGSNSTLSTIGTGQLLIQSDDRITMDTNDIVLKPLNGISIINNVPLVFGDLDDANSGRVYTDSDGKLHISDPQGIVLDRNVTINGTFTVYGQSTEINSTKTVYFDPIITLGKDAPTDELKDRGVEFLWHENGNEKWGFMGFSQQIQRFRLLRDGVNVDEIYQNYNLGDLELGSLFVESIVSTVGITSSSITGNPDIHFNATDIFIAATNRIHIPEGIALESGNSQIKSTPAGFVIDSPSVYFPGGKLEIGTAILTLPDINNLRIGNVPNIYLDGIVYVQSSLRFGTDQVSINIDADQNVHFSAPGNIILTSKTIMNAGMQTGNALMQWNLDVPGGRILWKSTLPDSELNVSVIGNILDANWKGSPISLQYGGTGHVGPWQAKSVVYVGDTGLSLDEDNDNFVFNHNTSCLGIRTSDPKNAFVLGSGNLDFLHNESSVLFRHNGALSWSIGKVQRNFGITGTFVSGINDSNSLSAYFLINPFGQIGIGQSIAFINGLSGLTSESLLYVGGNVQFTNPLSSIKWSQTEYINGQDGTLTFASEKSIEYLSPVFFHQSSHFFEIESRIFGEINGRLTIDSSTKTTLSSPHVVVKNRLCLHHDSSTDECQMYVTRNNDNNMEIVNDIGEILLQPLSTVFLDDSKYFVFGNGGSIRGVGNNLIISSSNSVTLGGGLNVSEGSNFQFGDKTVLRQDGDRFVVQSSTPISLNTSDVKLPDNTNLIFGDYSRRIVSDGDTLFIYSTDLLSLESNNVRISGNLVVSKKSTFTIESETNFDSGVIILGGGNNNKIVNLSSWRGTSTLVTTSESHNLRVGDTIFIRDTIPNIDGTFLVAEIPTSTSFSIESPFPGVPIGSDVQGVARSALTTNGGFDLGVQFNWHTGATNDTSSSRTGFFGFDRSTKRFTFLTEASNNNHVFNGSPGDFEIGNIYATGLSSPKLLSPLNTQGYLVTGNNFSINGGNINNTIIGDVNPSIGIFTNLTVSDGMTVANSNLVTNLNADLLDNRHAIDFLLRDGSLSLLNDWNAGAFRIISNGLTDQTLTNKGIIFSGTSGELKTSDMYYENSTLIIPFISAFASTGNINLNSNSIQNGVLEQSTVRDSDVTISSGRTFDASAGNVIFANDQLSGNFLSGGIADIDISGTASLVQDGVYRRDFNAGNTILKADESGQPQTLQIPENTFVGRRQGGVIEAISVPDIIDIFDVIKNDIYIDNSIVKADESGNPYAITLPEGTILGRKINGQIQALTPEETKDILQIEATDVYEQGSLMRDGHLTHPEGGMMTGLLYTSFERFTIVTGQELALDLNVETSYISVSYSKVGGRIAQCTLGHGYADGHRKLIILSDSAEFALLKVDCEYLAPAVTNAKSLVFISRGQSAMLQFDSVMSCWFIVNSGAFTITSNDLENPDWIEQYITGDN